MWEKLSIEDAAPYLIRDRVVVKAMRSQYGKDAERYIKAIRRKKPAEFEDASPYVYDLLEETLAERGRLYVRYMGKGPDDDRYPIDISGLGGIYVVSAPECGSYGLFNSLDDADSWLADNWNDNLASYGGRRYRKPFSPEGKDGVPRPRR